MAKTPTSYDPNFWSTLDFRGLNLFSSEPIGDALIVARLLLQYYQYTSERPTDFSYKINGRRQKKSRSGTEEKILDKVKLAEGELETMYIETIRDRDHTHAVVSLGYSYNTIGRADACFSADCALEDFDISAAQELVRAVAKAVQIDYGFSHCQKGLINSVSYGGGLRILSDPFSSKRERWFQDFRLNGPLTAQFPFLDLFELNVLSDIHMCKAVAGRPFDVYVREKGRGQLEQVGKANFLWCLDQRDLEGTKADLVDAGLLALS